jgi:metal-responsive CopG/Arc/MetJ family transcriptional regulator
MPEPSNMVTSRLPQELIEKLDRVAHDSRRSRSWVIKEALEAYLNGTRRQPTSLMSYAGVGVNLSTRRTAEEVESEIRWLRDND